MKKSKIFPVICMAVAICFGSIFVGCGKKENALSVYSGTEQNADGSMRYNPSLFYTNSVIQGYPDPQVLDNTARDGYYYLYGTANGFFTMRSTNLTEWENVGPTFNNKQSDLVRRCTKQDVWAPEVIYDNGTYYLYFSATPEADTSVSNADGIVREREKRYCMYVATSDSPAGPFTMVNFNGRHSYNTQPNQTLTAQEAQSGTYAYVTKTVGEGQDATTTYYKAAFPHFYAQFCLFSPDELSKFMAKNSAADVEAKFWPTIDPHPFVDPQTQKKYMYFKVESNNSEWTRIVGVEMQDWLTPIWSTAKYITANGYYSVADWQNNATDRVTYEDNVCNEGPHMLYHEDGDGNKLYYMTFSVNGYTDSSYQVGMAVASSPLGDFRKLTEAEGGLLLSSNSTGSQSISGAGHHSFITIGSQLYIVYHRHKNYSAGGAERYVAVDEIKWLTVKDKNDRDMTIPYVNGPTDSIQPQPTAFSKYKDVASEATVTASGDVTALGALTDGYLSVRKISAGADLDFAEYVPETKIEKTTTFTFDFASARNARAIMVYNSAYETEIFEKVSRIELTLADGSVRVVRDVLFDKEQYCDFSGYDGRVIYVKSGAAAFIEFYDVNVKTVKITVDVPAGQEKVGLSEIRILGKAA